MRARKPVGCKKTLKKVTTPSGYVFFEPINPGVSHNHDLEVIDRSWRCQAFKEAAAEEAERSYAPAEIFRSMLAT